jgi:hypothetical protein
MEVSEKVNSSNKKKEQPIGKDSATCKCLLF